MFYRYRSSPLVCITGILNQFENIDILQNYVQPFKNKFYSGNTGFMYQHNGWVPHQTKGVALFLGANGINVLQWPAQGPYLNPIENVWSIMKRCLRMLPKHPTTADKLLELLCDSWNKLPEDYFRKFSDSIVRHCNAIKNGSDSSSKYWNIGKIRFHWVKLQFHVLLETEGSNFCRLLYISWKSSSIDDLRIPAT